jgi:opacity protein-like surface antigen
MTALLVAAGVVAMTANGAQAQTLPQNIGRVEVSIIPAAGVFFTEGADTQEPSFANYGVGGAIAFDVNRFFGVEGEISGALGVSQSLDLGGITTNQDTPDLLQYSANVVVALARRSSVVPYVTGGVGGLSLFEQASLGIANTETFLTGNVGGGVKWYAGRWGVRGDYRFVGAQSKDDAPVFFGRESRYGHRVYGAVIVNVGR